MRPSVKCSKKRPQAMVKGAMVHPPKANADFLALYHGGCAHQAQATLPTDS